MYLYTLQLYETHGPCHCVCPQSLEVRGVLNGAADLIHFMCKALVGALGEGPQLLCMAGTASVSYPLKGLTLPAPPVYATQRNTTRSKVA